LNDKEVIALIHEASEKHCLGGYSAQATSNGWAVIFVDGFCRIFNVLSEIKEGNKIATEAAQATNQGTQALNEKLDKLIEVQREVVVAMQRVCDAIATMKEPVELEKVCASPDCTGTFTPKLGGHEQLYCSSKCQRRDYQRKQRVKAKKKTTVEPVIVTPNIDEIPDEDV